MPAPHLTVPADQALPAVLRDPPWTGGRRAAEPPRLDLPPLDAPPRLRWSDEERERMLREATAVWSGSAPLDRDGILRFLDRCGVRAESRERLLAGQAVAARDLVDPAPSAAGSGYELLGLPPAVAIGLWNLLPAASWQAGELSVQVMLARHGDAVLPGFLAFAQRHPVQGLRVGRWVDASALGHIALRALCGPAFGHAVATTWLLTHTDTASRVLLHGLFGADDAAREAARSVLHRLADAGLRASLQHAAEACGPEAAAALAEQLGTDPLLRLPARLPKLPPFFDPAALHRPRLRDDGSALPDDAMRHLGLMLAIGTPERPYAGLDAVRAACTPASLAEFAWTLFEAWWRAQAPSASAWCFRSLALLGDDSTAHRLGPRVLRLAREGAKNRAVAAVDMLAGFGSDAALMHLDTIAERCKVPAVRNRARAHVDEVAAARGLSRDELADRLVPTLELDEAGGRVLDFGPRRFRIGFDERLVPFVSDADGARLKDLPKPRQTDDTAQSAASTLRWKQLKAELKSLAAAQIVRLEQAMVAQRSWSAGDFERFFRRHALMRELAARLLWSLHDGDGALRGAFRLAEDGTAADAHDTLVVPPDGSCCRIAHPAVLPEPLRHAFARQFADYDILQPFAQLAREVHAPTPEEAAGRTLHRVAGREVATGAVLGLIDRSGWQRGPVGDGGIVASVVKPLGRLGARELHAELGLDPGMPVTQLSAFPRQRLLQLTLAAPAPGDPPAGVTFADVPPLACSELLRDLHLLAPTPP